MPLIEILMPDMGNFEQVSVIEILVSAGDVIVAETPLVTVESDKASMDIPSPLAGVVKAIHVKNGDKVSRGSSLLSVEIDASVPITGHSPAKDYVEPKPALVIPEATRPAAPPPTPIEPAHTPAPVGEHLLMANTKLPHASPSVRKFARSLGVDLSHLKGSGKSGRILHSDVETYVKTELAKPRTENMGAGISSLATLQMPLIDFSQFGEVEHKPLSRIKKISGANLHRNWITAPHVTQFDEADITDLEAFRKSMLSEAEKRGAKLTLLAFLMKAVVNGLRAYPHFNASLSADGDHLIIKHYFNIGFACDTPDGLVVPVVHNVDSKDVLAIARDLGELSARARERKLKVDEMQGGCFTISSLGGIGGTMFTPNINCPEVAILGVSRASYQPIYDSKRSDFEPRLMLPLSLSYDHRVIDGADGARFTSHLRMMLSDVRRLLL
ncbi:MAG: dihydrolipoyllysine-residue acetyltransferase [Methylophilaceae bacterium]|nr:dihydrolipoyllysine-residue acetyltransferase [Methylophilaceae bacterium]